MHISESKAFLILEAAQLGCYKMKSLISAMEIFGLHWSFLNYPSNSKTVPLMFKDA
jgi:hypothetical protein